MHCNGQQESQLLIPGRTVANWKALFSYNKRFHFFFFNSPAADYEGKKEEEILYLKMLSGQSQYGQTNCKSSKLLLYIPA